MNALAGHYGAVEEEPSRLVSLGVPAASLLLMGITYEDTFSKHKSKRARNARRLYGLAVLGLAGSVFVSHRAGAYQEMLSGPYGDLGGVSKKIGRLEKKIARLEKRLAKKEAKGRSKAVARIQAKLDKAHAKLRALTGQASSDGLPGYGPVEDPGLPPVYDMEPAGLPTWALPAAIGGGVLLVVIAMMSRKDG